MAGRVRHSILLQKCSPAGMAKALNPLGEHFCIIWPA